MRRITFIALASAVVFALSPASALARHHRGQHHGHHARKHHKRHSRAHIKRFGTTSNSGTSAGDTAGHVVSFTNGVLMIELNDHSTVSGRVTDATELECRAPEDAGADTQEEATEASHADGDRGGENRGEENRGDEQENEQEGNQNCSTANLTPGTAVKEAELRISGSGSVWKKVELVSQSA